MRLIIKITIVPFVSSLSGVWKTALNDNESHYLNGFTIAAFVKFSASSAKFHDNESHYLNYTHIFRVCQEKKREKW